MKEASMDAAEFHRVETEEQIALVARLAREIWTEHYTPIIGPEQVDYMLERFQSAEAVKRQLQQEGYEYYLAECGGKPAGYLALVPGREPGAMFLSKIYVHRRHRGRGLGADMLELAEERAEELGLERIYLTCNKHNTGSLAFYRAHGYANAGPVVTDIGGGYVMDDWRMEKEPG
jgi:GNAT superfamily N-acetyltransferase